MLSKILAAILNVACCAALAQQAPPRTPRYLRFDEAREIIAGFTSNGLAPQDVSHVSAAAGWDSWIRARDREIRARIDRGVEDSISNLALYGTSFTPLARFEGGEDAVGPDGTLVPAARDRVRALVAASSQPQPGNERLAFVRDYMEHRGVRPASAEALLEANLLRFAVEQREYQNKLKAAGKSSDPDELLYVRSTLYSRRGLSVDTSLLPNFAIEDTLAAMLRKGALRPASIGRIAVIGPGLDFADKREGYDYYPLQTIQPFALLEAVARLRLGDPEKVHVVALDLNPLVLQHVRQLAERARAGRSYSIQLPRDTTVDWTNPAEAYWRHFGDLIGTGTEPRPPPPGLKTVTARAIAIPPQYASRLSGVNLDVVAQTLDQGPGEGFDLVVATNVLVYYDLFQQALAMTSVAHMMNPRGVLLVNHTLPAQHPSALEYLGRRSVSYSAAGAFGDDVVVYRRR